MALYHTFMVSISVLYLLITPSHLCFGAALKKPTGFSLKLIHRDSPESPLYPGNLTSIERMSRYAKLSGVRASYLASIASKNATIRPPVYNDDISYYMVSIGIGTPMRNIMLLLDTAAPLTWTQCLPCESCFYQKYAIYDSLASQTFQPIHCNHTLCNDFLECTANTCWYHMYYGSGSHTSGLAMTETLTFLGDDRHLMSVDDIVIGCSKNNQNFPFGSTGNIGGIMGLGPSPHSLVSQLGGMTENKFSYCLTPPGESFSAYLRFGSDTIMRGSEQVQKTPFVRQGAYYYGLTLRDISISDVPIGYPNGTFGGAHGGCIIDSGSPFSQIEHEAFNTFIEAFENYFTPSTIARKFKDCPYPYMYCYYYHGVQQFPYMTLHFEGADYDIPPENFIWLSDKTDSYFVLTIVSSDKTVLGAWQQHNMRLVYDLHEGFLSFVPEVCSNDRN